MLLVLYHVLALNYLLSQLLNKLIFLLDKHRHFVSEDLFRVFYFLTFELAFEPEDLYSFTLAFCLFRWWFSFKIKLKSWLLFFSVPVQVLGLCQAMITSAKVLIVKFEDVVGLVFAGVKCINDLFEIGIVPINLFI